ncbi:MAG: phosphotransferase family protein [Candidatus Nanohaloarchaea archaeon]
MKPKLKQKVEERLDEVFDWRELDEGLNTIYLLESDEKKLILKERTNEMNEIEWFRSEPIIYSLISNKTDVPSPEVIHTDLEGENRENIFYIMEKIDGVNAENFKEEISQKQLEEILRQYGEILARIHNIRSFDKHGVLGAENGELKVFEGAERWDRALHGMMSGLRDKIGRLWENPPEIHVPDRKKLAEEVPKNPEAVLVHYDNRFNNILVDENEITGFLDWSHPKVGPRELDLARAEYMLVDWRLTDRDDLDEKSLKDSICEGYREVSDLERKEFEDRIRIYNYLTTLVLMGGFPNWSSDWEEEIKEEMREGLLRRYNRWREECDFLFD